MDQIESIDGNQYSIDGTKLAIIGMAGRFPGAINITEFWENLKAGVESISFFTDEEVLATGVRPKLVKDPHYVKAGGVLEDVDQFDAEFFGFYPQEAAILDPQHRLFLETSWQALENSGYNPETYPGWIGVFAGTGMNSYMLFNLITNQYVMENVHGYQLTISNDKDFLPTRVSYKLNLRGPSVNIQTACSTSLVAVHLACQSLLNFQCDIALAGGVAIRFPQKQGYQYQEGGIGSPDGHCRAFDANAKGTVGGNGVGVVVIKRLEDAINHGDNILAVIRGSAINNDGSMKVGYTAPSVEGQSEVVATAQILANVDSETITYIETHGTGTELGDPIEITALTKVFEANTFNTEFCAIGSVKTNVGHLDAAAGVTSVIKTVLALQNKQIPPSINFDAPNPRIDFKNSPFFVNTELRVWKTDGFPRRAGISSFGIGGTNAHVVVEEAPELPESGPSREWQLLPISARTPAALEDATDNIVEFLLSHPNLNLADVAYTLKVGRKAFDNRRFVVVRDLQHGANYFKTREPAHVFTELKDKSAPQHTPPLVFMFPGQGAQYVNMTRELYETEPIFREQVDLCFQLLEPHLGQDIRDLIFPLDDSEETLEVSADKIKQTVITQPALFVIEYSLAQLFIEWGIHPKAMIGHSIGEFVAACLAGVFSLDDAIAIVAERGRLMQSLPGGSMISLPMKEAEAHNLIAQLEVECPNLSLAVVNAPELCAVSGPDDEIDTLIRSLEDQEVEYRRLHTSHAFHSPMMEPILTSFAQYVEQVELAEPEIPFISNVTGTWITPEEATDPHYWALHLRNTVRFSKGIETLYEDPSWIFIEIGPGRTLSTLTRAVMTAISSESLAQAAGQGNVIQTVRHPRTQGPDHAFLLNAMGRLWLAGVNINWEAYYINGYRKRIPLPTYPFQRQRYWIEPDQSLSQYISSKNKAGDLIKRSDLNEWFYLPSWKRLNLISDSSTNTDSADWLLFIDPGQNNDWEAELHTRLVELNQNVTVVEMGDRFASKEKGRFVINPGESSDYSTLIGELKSSDSIPSFVLHMWGFSDTYETESKINANAPFEDYELGYISLLNFAKAINEHAVYDQIQFGVLTNNTQDIYGSEKINPNQAPVVGLSRVVSQEIPNLICRSIDLVPELVNSGQNGRITNRIILELIEQPSERIVAYRGNHRWVQLYEPIRYNIPDPGDRIPTRLREEGVYLITGGLGRIGLTLADYLARKVRARIILVDRFEFPAGTTPAEWEAWLANHNDDERISKRVQKLQGMYQAGADVLILQADVTDFDQMHAVMQNIENEYGTLHGVIHAAGIVGEGAIKPIIETDRKNSEIQFLPKINGTKVLAKLLEGKSLDFVFLQSSLSAILGGLGLGAYSAANQYLDTFAAVQNRTNDTPWICVDWDGWLFEEEQEIERTLVDLSMTPDEGVLIFEKLMSMVGETHIIISTADLDVRIKQWVQTSYGDIRESILIEPDLEKQEQSGSTMSFPRPGLQTPYVPARDDLEESIVQTWQHVLGIEPIGIHDDFFELGGHSLLATQLVTRLRDTYNVQLPLRRLFESATVAGIAELISDAISERALEKPSDEEIRWETKKLQETARDGHIFAVPREGDLQLSYGQQRLWFLDQMDPESPLYNNFSAIRMTGVLNIEGFQYSLNKMIERHEVLRTTFREIEGKPSQIIHPNMVVPINLIDLSDKTLEDAENKVIQLATEEARKPFDLSEAPLLRVTLIQLKEDEYILFQTMHHIISDGWSVRVLIEEVGAYYMTYLNLGSEDSAGFTLPELPIQYVDYAHWQREWLKGEVLEEQLDYWRDQLAEIDGSTGNVELLPDHPRPVYQTTNGESIWFELPIELSTKLVKVSQDEGVTLFMVLLAALQTLIYRYTGHEDVSVGTPIANRTKIETESLIGFVLNTLVIRSDLFGNPSFRDLLHRVREVALDAYAHQDIPFEMLVEALQPGRDLSRSPFFQIIFDLQDAPLSALEMPGLKIEPIKVDNGTAKFDLALSMEMQTKEQTEFILGGFFNFNRDLFETDTIQRLINNWIVLLESIVADPEKPISDLRILVPEEEQILLMDWNQRDKLLSSFEFVQDQFDQKVQESPGSTALTEVIGSFAYGQQLTYLELDQRSNQLAHYLQKTGVGPEKLVGVSVKRSIDMIIALLGILKSGSAFLPLDPSYPKGRLAYMVNDANIDILLTQESLLAGLPDSLNPDKEITRICLDRDWVKIAKEDTQTPVISITPENLAYLIYTSGSTGLPKGVMITHEDFGKHLQVMQHHFQITDTDRVLQFASLNFDAALEQIFTALISGANLCVRSEDIWPVDEFSRIVQELNLTVVNIPPAYWHQWAQYAANIEIQPFGESDDDEITLRLVIIGGDVMLEESLNIWERTALREARLLNAYGPTETTITASTYEVIEYGGATHSRSYHRIPIGYPLANRSVYVLDKGSNPVPIGVPGELHIGGMGLARGYLNNPDKTAEKFIPNPFYKLTKDADQIINWRDRLYKTGDLVRYLPGGEIEFLGRIDDQVKVRGFRIELGEIEAVLNMHSNINESVVMLREGVESKLTDDGKQLVAYVVPQPDYEPSISELYEHLKGHLPGYMIPASVIILDQMPISPSGKLDRRALPEPDQMRPDLEVVYLAPRTSIEEELAHLWSDMLSIEWDGALSPIGVNDNFFELGGHSLLATQIISRVRETYQVDLPIRRVFENPTIAGLSEIISQTLMDSVDSSEIETILNELEALSDEDAQALLADESPDQDVLNG